jgi:hypothetical protein
MWHFLSAKSWQSLRRQAAVTRSVWSARGLRPWSLVFSFSKICRPESLHSALRGQFTNTVSLNRISLWQASFVFPIACLVSLLSSCTNWFIFFMSRLICLHISFFTVCSQLPLTQFLTPYSSFITPSTSRLILLLDFHSCPRFFFHLNYISGACLEPTSLPYHPSFLQCM